MSSPTKTSEFGSIITMDGVVLSSFLFGIISTFPSLYTPIQEKVVPKSNPMANSLPEVSIKIIYNLIIKLILMLLN